MKSIAELETELDEATQAMASAEVKYQSARRDHTEALNRLNEAQKAFDAAVKEKRNNAPRCSDWKSEKRTRFDV